MKAGDQITLCGKMLVLLEEAEKSASKKAG
jgi:hypothetical protein